MTTYVCEECRKSWPHASAYKPEVMWHERKYGHHVFILNVVDDASSGQKETPDTGGTRLPPTPRVP